MKRENNRFEAHFSDVLLYVMSGTGNTFRVAKWIEASAQSLGISAKTVLAEQSRCSEEIVGSPDQLVGVLMPTHGFTAPWQMIRFVCRMPRMKHHPAFVLATRAGTKFGRVYLPGLEGTAGFLIALILAFKGYRVIGVSAADMPSNWIALHPGFSRSSAESIGERAKPRVEKFVDVLLSGRKSFGFGALASLFMGLVLLPVSALYLLQGRFFLSKLFFANNRCNGCGACAANCPVGAISMWGRKNKRPFWSFTCESCMRCMAYCPPNAIEAGHSWGVMLYYLAFNGVAVCYADWIVRMIPATGRLNAHVKWLLLYYPYFLTSVAISYIVLNLITRVPWINALFTYSTLTHFYRRYHEPGTDLKDLK